MSGTWTKVCDDALWKIWRNSELHCVDEFPDERVVSVIGGGNCIELHAVGCRSGEAPAILDAATARDIARALWEAADAQETP